MTVVIGASGLVGSHLLAEILAAGQPAAGSYHAHPVPGLFPLNMADESSIECILALKPSACVYAAGFTWVDGCESQQPKAMAENHAYPLRLAQACFHHGIHFTYFSTSYVFDGEGGCYKETDVPNPLNVYGKSKLLAEKDILRVTGNTALIPRIVCVFGVERQRKNFVYQVLKAVREGGVLRIPSDQWGNPTSAKDISRITGDLIRKKQQGVWHVAREQDNCTRLQWAELIASRAHRAGLMNAGFRIEPVKTVNLAQSAIRPLNAGMVSGKLSSFDYTFSDLRYSIDEVVSDFCS